MLIFVCRMLSCSHVIAFGADHARCGVLLRDLADVLRKQDRFVEARSLVYIYACVFFM